MENKDDKKRMALESKERIRGVFTKFFEKFDLKEEKKLASLGRAIIFIFFFACAVFFVHLVVITLGVGYFRTIFIKEIFDTITTCCPKKRNHYC